MQIEITGYVVAITSKSILLEQSEDGCRIWYSRQYCTVLSGYPRKGAWLRLSVPQWLYDKANGEQSALAAPPASNTGCGIPADMLKRLIYLCHPDKHSGNKASTLATEWLLQQRGRA